MKKRKTRKQKMILGLKRKLIKLDIEIEELNREIKKCIEEFNKEQERLDEERNQTGMSMVVNYSRLDGLYMFLSVCEMLKFEYKEELKKLKNKRGNIK